MMVFDSPRGNSETSPWREMRRLHDAMNRIFSRTTEPPLSAFPAVNLWASQDSAVVTTELPGMDLEDVEISVVGDMLSIRGSRKPEQLGEGDTYHRSERAHGRFSRVLQLPFRIEADEVSATLKNGLLNI